MKNRLSSFPVPEKRESVYSLLCRYSCRTGLQQNIIMTKLTGQERNEPLRSAIPGYLGEIAKAMPAGHPWYDNAALIIQNHTSLPYYTFFLSAIERKQKVHNLAAITNPTPLMYGLGLLFRKKKILLETQLRFCKECLEKDQNELGFAFFRVEHQLPAVNYCWEHKTPLYMGCKVCGAYPIRRHGLMMAGRCLCENGIRELPANNGGLSKEVLLWIAKESAFLASSKGTSSNNIVTDLRKLLTKNGVGSTKYLYIRKIAELIDKRFTPEILKWLGFSVWNNGQVAKWLPYSLYTSRSEHQNSVIACLLIIGTFYNSIYDFELDVKSVNEPISVKPRDKNNNIHENLPDWINKFLVLLKSENELSIIAKKIGVQTFDLIKIAKKIAQKRDIKISLPPRLRDSFPKNVLTNIKKDLEEGCPQKEIMNRHNVTYWQLVMILLSSPNIQKAQRDKQNTTFKKKRDNFRKQLLFYKKVNPEVSRSEVYNTLRSAYAFFIAHDKNWFYKQIPDKKYLSLSRNKPWKDWNKFDRKKSEEIKTYYLKTLDEDIRPTRTTETKLLKGVNLIASYHMKPQRFPLVSDIIEKLVETNDEYVERKIKWAMRQINKEGKKIQITYLRRMSSFTLPDIREKRELIEKYAAESNFPLDFPT